MQKCYLENFNKWKQFPLFQIVCKTSGHLPKKFPGTFSNADGDLPWNPMIAVCTDSL